MHLTRSVGLFDRLNGYDQYVVLKTVGLLGGRFCNDVHAWVGVDGEPDIVARTRMLASHLSKVCVPVLVCCCWCAGVQLCCCCCESRLISTQLQLCTWHIVVMVCSRASIQQQAIHPHTAHPTHPHAGFRN